MWLLQLDLFRLMKAALTTTFLLDPWAGAGLRKGGLKKAFLK